MKILNEKDILFYIPTLGIGGAERVVVDLINNMALKRVNICLVTDLNNISTHYIINSKVTIEHLNSNSFYFFKLYKLYKLLSIKRHYKIYSHLTHSNVQILIIKRFFLKLKVVVVEHSITTTYLKYMGFLKNLLFQFLIKFLYPYANSIICVSNVSRKDLISRFGLSNSLVKTIYNPIDFERILNLSAKYLELGMEEILNKRKFYVSIGRLVNYKGHIEIISGIANQLLEFNQCLLIVGNGDYQINIQNYILRKGLQKHVFILGNQSNPFVFIKRSIGLIHHSLFEGFGLILVEATFLKTSVFCIEKDYSLELNKILPSMFLFKNRAELQALIDKNMVTNIDVSDRFNSDQFKYFEVDNVCSLYLSNEH